MAERQITDPSQLPANNSKSRQPEEKPHVERVVNSKVHKKERGLFSKVRDASTGEDARSVGEYIIMDVLVPAAKRAVSDAVSQGIDRLLFGESRRRSDSRPGYTSYSSYSRPLYSNPPYRTERERRDIPYRSRATHDFSDIIIEDRVEAEDVIRNLENIIEQYEAVTVADLYDMVGITGTYVDRKWGWTDIRGASTRTVRGGYLLVLPRPVPIN